MARRVIIKVSGEGLAAHSDEHFHDETINRIVKETLSLVDGGVQACIVVGGGNFWRGRDASPNMDKVKAHQIGMLATVMNGVYLSEAFRILAGAGRAAVMTPFDVGAFTQRFTKEAAVERMENGAVPIFAGGTGHPFVSTDTIVGIRACELNVDAVLYGKSVEGVYDDDPRKNPDAKKYMTVSYETVMAKGLEVADISAVCLTAKEGIPSVVFGLGVPGGITTAAEGGDGLFAIGGTRIANGIADEFYNL